jgi:aminopeptidase N
MLRSRLGDAAFFKGVKTYYERHKNSTASTEDLRDALEVTSGQKLQQFFERWVYDSGHPQYEVSWTWIPKEKSVKLALTQVQPGNLFNDPVPVVLTSAGGKVKAVITPNSKVFEQTIRINSKPDRLEVDPDNTLLKEATVK